MIHKYLSQVTPVILSGGQGTRLWPLSRATMPKQFIPLLFGESLFEQTISRVLSSSILSEPIILCSKNHQTIVEGLIHKHSWSVQQIIAEPCGRNTSAALAMAALYRLSVASNKEDPILVMMPSDHYIPDTDLFLESMKVAIKLAEEEYIVAFGIEPHKPHIGFGYIEKGDACGQGFRVKKFHEKPSEDVAISYVESGVFYWNSGIIVTKARVYLDELRLYSPEVYASSLAAFNQSKSSEGNLILEKESFEKIPSIAIDYAIMEKTKKAVFVPALFRWDDLGSWDALWDICKKDEALNTKQGDVIALNTKNSMLWTSGPLLCTVGINNIIAVVEEDVVFIGTRKHAEDIKELVEVLKFKGRKELNSISKKMQ
jgi:mannose-1-phosphate guanylyltransferase/mannose-6-phosphate isomerase